MKDARHELIDYLALQFPATIGHIPLAEKIDEIRRQALLEAAEIADKLIHPKECDDKWSITRTGALISIRDAILARAKEVEAQPHSTDEKKTNPLCPGDDYEGEENYG